MVNLIRNGEIFNRGVHLLLILMKQLLLLIINKFKRRVNGYNYNYIDEFFN